MKAVEQITDDGLFTSLRTMRSHLYKGHSLDGLRYNQIYTEIKKRNLSSDLIGGGLVELGRHVNWLVCPKIESEDLDSLKENEKLIAIYHYGINVEPLDDIDIALMLGIEPIDVFLLREHLRASLEVIKKDLIKKLHEEYHERHLEKMKLTREIIHPEGNE